MATGGLHSEETNGHAIYLHNKTSKFANGHHRNPSLPHMPSSPTSVDHQHSDQTLIFNVEEALLRSTSLFPFFMLVAFEAGSPFRALVLLLLYPLMCIMGKDMRLRIMVMVCFFGIKRKSFYRVGRAVLPKFFLEDVGLEGFEKVMMYKTKVGVTRLPRVMVESFLRDYLGIDHVIGRELKEFHGYFNGLMEEIKINEARDIKEIVGEEMNTNVVGICDPSSHHPLLSTCKEIYVTSRKERSKWCALPREKYVRPLIFHDSRLILNPTPLTTLAVLMWFPFGLILAGIRALMFTCLPLRFLWPLLCFSGIRVLFSEAKPRDGKRSSLLSSLPWQSPLKINDARTKGTLYVCNHRTLFDPICLNIALDKNLTAVTFGLSRLSEMLSPIKTIRLTRQREKDVVIMEKMLSQGNLVVCPEATTCRERYLLRFSPLFAEMSDEIVPVAMNTCFTFFYTAGGSKCMDPIFFLMDPHPSYSIGFLEKVKGSSLCQMNGEGSKFDVANRVQAEIGKAFGFECTRLTRKDKYLILAGHDGSKH